MLLKKGRWATQTIEKRTPLDTTTPKKTIHHKNSRLYRTQWLKNTTLNYLFNLNVSPKSALVGCFLLLTTHKVSTQKQEHTFVICVFFLSSQKNLEKIRIDFFVISPGTGSELSEWLCRDNILFQYEPSQQFNSSQTFETKSDQVSGKHRSLNYFLQAKN